MKNEHIVYAYAPLLAGGGCLLLVGLTDVGWAYLQAEGGNVLSVTPPSDLVDKEVANVKAIWIVRARNKQEIHDMIRTVAKQHGATIVETH